MHTCCSSTVSIVPVPRQSSSFVQLKPISSRVKFIGKPFVNHKNDFGVPVDRFQESSVYCIRFLECCFSTENDVHVDSHGVFPFQESGLAKITSN